MPVEFSCVCGKKLKAPDGAQGKRARCPKCGAIVTVPAPADLEIAGDPHEFHTPATPRLTTATTRPRSQRPIVASPSSAFQTPVLIARPNLLQRYGYLLLLVALIPLILSAFKPSDSLEARLERTIAAHPEMPDLSLRIDNLLTNMEQGKLTKEQFFAALPNDRLEGALLPYQTEAHWLLALGAVVGYFIFLSVAFPGSIRFIKGLLFAGIFTGTLGILILLFFQWAAISAPLIRVRGVVGLIFLIIKLIGLSYALADSDAGFLLSFIGFTCGVGLCEEVTKAIPLLLRIKPTPGVDDPSWQSLLLWGLASGVGFGIAEGIMYSGRYYNGIQGADAYAVRFLSCVVLHAVWAGANGIAIYRSQGDLLGCDTNWGYAARVVQVVWVPMVLHGLYDTLLKKDYELLAVAVALASFAWLAWQVERAHRAEPALAKT